MPQDLFAGPWKSRLDRLAGALRTVHKRLIDSTQRDYERAHGRVASPYALFALVAKDPAFAWLQPMTRLIVEIEDLVGRTAPPPGREDLEQTRRRVRGLLSEGGFASDYHARVQSDPAVAAEHGRLQSVLGSDMNIV